MDLGQALKDAVKKNLNLSGFFSDIVDKVADPALRAAVAQSPNPIDDVVVAALAPLLEKALKDLVSQEIAKLLP